MFGRRRQPSDYMAQPQKPQQQPLPPGYHDGVLAQISIKRRQGRRTKNGGFQPAGWDLVDTYSGQIIAEYNDETAPPPSYLPRSSSWSMPHTGRITGHGRNPLAPTGNELGELFQAIYTLCYNTTMDAINVMAEAIPEHKDSPDGATIAQLAIRAVTKLPVTANVSKKQAQSQEPF